MILSESARSSAGRNVSRRGLTLIELIVVMMILIALAGLLVPMLPSMLTRAHTSTCSTNMGETVRAITNYQALYSQYPSNFDALSDGKTLIDYLAGGAAATNAGITGQGAGPGNNEVTGITLTANEATNLTGVGISTLQAMVPSATGAPAGFDPTFNYYPATANPPTDNTLAVAGGLVVGGMDPTHDGNTSTSWARCVALNLPTTGRYVVVGIGPRVGMVGKTIQTAPVHFGDQPALNPEYGYERLVAIFQISDSAPGVTMTQARLVGTAPIHDTGVGSIQDELQNWYQLTTGGS